jgi:ABC-type bacteriocin/lantibiotic exporter with double-glycine peptidase domain
MRDTLSYIASTIIGITAVVILIQGAVTDNFDNVTIGMFLAVITIVLATATAIKNQLLKELKK